MTTRPRVADDKLDDETRVLVSVAKRQWERTFDAISEPLMLVDTNYVIRRANLALADELGMAIQRVVGQRCHEVRAVSPQRFVGSGAQPCVGCPVAEARRCGVAADGEVRSAHGRTFKLRAFPVLDEVDDEKMTVCHYHDVTDERVMTTELASAERLAAIGRLAGGVAHEINNPLGGILAFTQILQRDTVTDAERKEYLGEIERSALRCKEIVDALVRFARQASPHESRSLLVNDIVRDSVRAFAAREPERAQPARLDLGERVPPVMGDAGQLQLVVTHLLTNALDGGGRRGDVEIATSSDTDDVLITVRDRGAGIPEEHLPRLYDPFFTTKEEGKGRGLGLAVVYAIVQEHGGKIVARNREGGGAEFVVTLPAAEKSG
ncbi:MAG TPA: ATP-binding protein [Polyangia bacterium]|jgi:two-component system NtrC family sensor kinase|nr:ATP-binding protein [Polyangia bacterium]